MPYLLAWLHDPDRAKMSTLPVPITNALGVTRAQVSCKLCGERWVEESREGEHGETHFCEKMKAAAGQAIARVSNRPDALAVMGQFQLILLREALAYRPMTWNETGSPSKCTYACKHAKGVTCDCECGGRYHGSQVVVKKS